MFFKQQAGKERKARVPNAPLHKDALSSAQAQERQPHAPPDEAAVQDIAALSAAARAFAL